MKTIPSLLALVAFSAPLAAQEPFVAPKWAYPSPSSAPAFDTSKVYRIKGSSQAFTLKEIYARNGVADWHPGNHPPAPPAVMLGVKGRAFACAYCHTAEGGGKPENAMLAGLPAEYIMRQVADFRSRKRYGAHEGAYGATDAMRTVADSASPEAVAEAAEYYSRLKAPRHRSQVIEATTIPLPTPALGLYFGATDGRREPLGHRIIEMPVDAERHELRDAAVTYVAYVPRGSIARGRVLATKGPGNVVAKACTTCHGPQLRGVGVVPPIAGRSPSYLLRQLFAFRTGARAAESGAPMREVAGMLTLDDMIAVAAYAGRRVP